MHDAPNDTAPFPRLLPGRPGTSTEGRAFIVTLRGDTRSEDRIRNASGEMLRERDNLLIWGFPGGTEEEELEALCTELRQPDPSPKETVLGPAADGWDFDISAAPKGKERIISGKVAGTREYERNIHVRERIFAAGNGGVVTVSYWVPEQGRWNMFTKAVPPMAWRPYVEGAPLPRHPLAG